mgnify:CR=1 FL=1
MMEDGWLDTVLYQISCVGAKYDGGGWSGLPW